MALQAIKHAPFDQAGDIGITNLDIDAEEPAGAPVASPALTDRSGGLARHT
jgi:hypothetical protein